MEFSLTCPNCGAADYYKSHTRNVYEKLRKAILHQRPYRCHLCDHRGWVSFETYVAGFSKQHTTLYFVVVLISILLGIIAGTTMN